MNPKSLLELKRSIAGLVSSNNLKPAIDLLNDNSFMYPYPASVRTVCINLSSRYTSLTEGIRSQTLSDEQSDLRRNRLTRDILSAAGISKEREPINVKQDDIPVYSMNDIIFITDMLDDEMMIYDKDLIVQALRVGTMSLRAQSTTINLEPDFGFIESKLN